METIASLSVKNKFAIGAIAFFATAFAVMVNPAQALAQQTNNGPISISADSVDFQPQNNTTTISGHAEVVNGDKVLRAPTFRIISGADGTAQAGKIQKVYSEGETFLVTPTQKVRADKAFYDAINNIIIFTGNVILVQGQSVAQGDELRVNTITNQSQLKSNNGRVKAVMFPNDQPSAKPKAKK
jgi:lipopolysaccharide export system protein LptA